MLNSRKVSFVLVDDHIIFREGLIHIIEKEPNFEVVGNASDGLEGYNLIRALQPDIAIIDISLPVFTGINLVSKLKQESIATKCIILTRHDNMQYLNELLKYSIHGFVLKSEAAGNLLNAIHLVIKGEQYISQRLAENFQTLKQSLAKDHVISTAQLTTREKEIIKLLAEGYSNHQISKILHISTETVKVHRKNIIKKLGSKNIAEIIRFARSAGLTET